MTIKTKIAALAVAALTVAGSIATTTTKAEAHGFHHGWGFGGALLGAAIVGSAIAASTPAPYYFAFPMPGAPVRRVRPLHRHRERLLLISSLTLALRPRVSAADPLHPRDFIHPVSCPDPPGRPPGRVTLFTAAMKGQPQHATLQGRHRTMPTQQPRRFGPLYLRITRNKAGLSGLSVRGIAGHFALFLV